MILINLECLLMNNNEVLFKGRSLGYLTPEEIKTKTAPATPNNPFVSASELDEHQTKSNSKIMIEELEWVLSQTDRVKLTSKIKDRIKKLKELEK